jgi:hypothetical protein
MSRISYILLNKKKTPVIGMYSTMKKMRVNIKPTLRVLKNVLYVNGQFTKSNG